MDGLVLPVEDLSSLRDAYIRWYLDITRRAGVDRWMMVIQGPPSSPTQVASFAKKVQTIICRCMVSIGSTLGCTPSQHDIQSTFPVQPSRHCPREPVLERDARGVKRGARRLPDGGARGGCPPVPPLRADKDMQTSDVEKREAPPPPGTVGSSTPHMPISYASSSDSDEHDDEQTNDVTPTQQLEFGHRVGKKITRFTPSNWP
ncbi:hypothetical protein M9H77_34424 [Catharanthus roseus]|uniref:Uncharacterized protein n=1 Tax=Catharanthus roseus TaxID=4058 RepID=A0ACB9ZMV4_CATRO|nr:hypothetical protein M9H77_34424 [Catharanthus roseus]